MKRFILTLTILFSFVALASARQLKYVDATQLNIIGKVLSTPKPFTRVDTEKYPFEDKTIQRYAEFSTGLMVVFSTDSRTIAAKWKTSPVNAGYNMNSILYKGLDLYIKKDGKWIFAGVGKPSMGKAPYDEHEGIIVENMPEGTKECLLYLPVFDRIDALEIGIDESAAIAPMDNPFRYKIVFKGSSVTHGTAASRPGMTYPARFGRDNNFYVCNLGFSGKSKLQKEYARIIADTQADAFVFDAFSNPLADEINERFDDFVDIIRAAHPYTPLIFLQTERRETRNFNMVIEEREAAKQKAAEEQITERMKTDRHIYFITSEDFLGHDHIATADGSHPTDLGFTYMLESISPKILKILKKYGIR